MNSSKQNVIYRIIEYGLNDSRVKDGVMVRGKLIEDCQLTDFDQIYLNNVLACNDEKLLNANHILIRFHTGHSTDAKDWQYKLLPTAIFQYNDYLEIKAAREAAKESKKLAWIAIIFSSALGVFGLIVGILQLNQKC